MYTRVFGWLLPAHTPANSVAPISQPPPQTSYPPAPTVALARAPTYTSDPPAAPTLRRAQLHDVSALTAYSSSGSSPARSREPRLDALTQNMQQLSLQSNTHMHCYPLENITASNVVLWQNFSKIFSHLKDIFARSFEHCGTPGIDPLAHIKETLCSRPSEFAFNGMEIAYALVLLIKILGNMDNMDNKNNTAKMKYKLNNNPKPIEENICVNDIGLLFFVALKFSKGYLTDMSARQARAHPFYRFAFTQQKITENPLRCRALFETYSQHVLRVLDFTVRLPFSVVGPVYGCLFPENADAIMRAEHLSLIQDSTTTQVLNARLATLLAERSQDTLQQHQTTAINKLLIPLLSLTIQTECIPELKQKIKDLLRTFSQTNEPLIEVFEPKPSNTEMLPSFDKALEKEAQKHKDAKAINPSAYNTWSP